jgi:hypothetical protein
LISSSDAGFSNAEVSPSFSPRYAARTPESVLSWVDEKPVAFVELRILRVALVAIVLDEQVHCSKLGGYESNSCCLLTILDDVVELERAYQRGDTNYLYVVRVDPMLDDLRGHPRFDALVQKIVGGT